MYTDSDVQGTNFTVRERCHIVNLCDAVDWCTDSATATSSTELLEAFVYEHSDRLDVLEALDDDFNWNNFSTVLDDPTCDFDERRALEAEIAACIVRMVISLV
jgi:hypothetical protein